MKMQKAFRNLVIMLAVLVLAAPISIFAAPLEQTNPPEVRAQAILDSLSPEEKVGQLFLVTFEGDDADLQSDIAHLAQVLRVGSVLLSPANRNFVNDAVAPTQVLSLTTALQQLAFTPSASAIRQRPARRRSMSRRCKRSPRRPAASTSTPTIASS